MRKPRKNYTPSEKVAILRRHLLDRVPVSNLCDEGGKWCQFIFRGRRGKMVSIHFSG
jgi:hypothetical protein